MKVVFTGNPYKFWNRTCDCELHLFQDNELADQYAISLINSPLRDEMPCVCDTPNEFWVGESWAKLLCDYASCQGFDKIVLHPDDGGIPNGFIEWTIATALPCDTTINWTWPSETPLHIKKIYANIWLIRDDGTPNSWLRGAVKNRERKLCSLLYDLFDVTPFEIYDFYYDNRCTGNLMEVDEIIR